MSDPAYAVEALVKHYNTAELSEARMFRKIMREYSAHLNEIQLRVLLFIFDRTYTYGKVSETIPMRHFLEGVALADGTVLHPPIRKDRATIYRALDFLVDNVIILRSQAGRSSPPVFTINPAWMPRVSRQCDKGVASVRQGVRCNATHNNKNITHRYEQVAPAPTHGAIAEEKEMQARDAVLAAVAGATAKSQAARDKRKSKLNATALEKIWEDAFRDAYPDDTFFKWRVFEQSAFKRAVARGVSRSETEAFVTFAVSRFDNVINERFAWMKSKPTPSVGFVTKHIAEFYQAFSDDKDPNRKVRRRSQEAPAREAPAKETVDASEVARLKAENAALKAKVGKQGTEAKSKRKLLIKRRPERTEFGSWED